MLIGKTTLIRDLTELSERIAAPGSRLAAEAVAAPGAPPVLYGEAAIVGARRSTARPGCAHDGESQCAPPTAAVRRSRCNT